MAVLWELAAGRNFDPFGQAMRGYQGGQAAAMADQRRSFLQQLAGDPNVDYGKTALGLLQYGDADGAKVAASIGKMRADEQSGYYGTPIYAERDGQPVLGTFNRRGDWREINTNGAVPSPGVKTLDTGTGYAIINARSGGLISGGQTPQGGPTQTQTQPPQNTSPDQQTQTPPPQPSMRPQVTQGYVQKDVAGVERQQAMGQQEGKNLANLPKAIDAGMQTLKVLDEAVNHPGRATATGMSGLFDPRNYIRGTDAVNFQSVLSQIKGRAFLQAFETLKGGGQITVIEGEKATAAIARLETAQSDAEFKKSLIELRDIVERGLRKTEQLQDKINRGTIDVRPYGENPAQQQRRSGLDVLDVPTRNRAIAELRYRMKSDPRAVEQFDEHFGVGSAAKALKWNDGRP